VADRFRSAARLTSTMLALLALSATPAHATSTSTTTGSQAPANLIPAEAANGLSSTVSRGTALESLNPQAIAYYMEYYGVSEPTARERLATAAMVPNIEPLLAQRLGSGFTDVWFDDATGSWVIDARAEASSETITNLMTELGLPGHYRVQRVDYSAAQLNATRQAVSQELRGLESAGRAVVGLGRGDVVVSIASSATTSELAEINLARASATDNAPVEVELNPQLNYPTKEGVGCSASSEYKYCNTLVGGDHWFGEHVGCTMAYFVAIKGREPWVPSMVTAGHCIADMGGLVKPVYTCEPGGGCSGDQWGLDLTFFQGDGHGDAGLLDDYSGQYSGVPAFAIYGGYWNWSIGTLSKLESYYTGNPPVGISVCKQGSISGSSCGTINKVGIEKTDSEGHKLVDQFEVINAKVCHGDSGSPWDSSTSDTAVGIFDLFTESEPPCGTTSWDTTIGEIVSFWNLAVYGGEWGPW
jgi:hypothetical protein